MNNLREVIKTLKDMSHDVPCGWMSDYTLDLVTALIRHYKPDLVINTGILWGKSLAFILQALSEEPIIIEENKDSCGDPEYYKFITKNMRPLPTTKTVVAVDPNTFGLKVDNAIEYLKSQYPNIQLDFWKVKSDLFFKEYKPTFKYDFLFGIVDGDHTAEGCRLDLINLGNMRANIIVVDDVEWLPYLNNVCKDFAEWHGYNYTKFQFDSGLGLLTR